MDPGAARRFQVDVAFPLSDHADYSDLLRYVEVVRPVASSPFTGSRRNSRAIFEARDGGVGIDRTINWSSRSPCRAP